MAEDDSTVADFMRRARVARDDRRPLPPAIGRFAIRDELGAGGMGIVYRASDPLLAREVALKVLHRDDRDEARRRFVREAQAMARVSHDNIVVVHEVGSDGDRVYIAMELIDGGTLRQWQIGRPWPDVVAAYVRAGRGLCAAHDAGLVHRDFKPDNVLVEDDGKLRVTDFGLVAAIDTPDATAHPDDRSELAASLTRSSVAMGTPRYMAPEQHAREPVDARADQFAFCVALYEALYGQPPFAGSTVAELADRVVAGDVRPVPDNDVPHRVRDAILRGLRRDRDERFASMRDLLAVLDPPQRRRARWIVPAVVAVAVAAIAGSIAVALWMRSDAIAAREREARGDEVDTRAAGEKFARAEDEFAAGNYDKAALGFLDAYAEKREPEFLYNIGAAYRMKAKRGGGRADYQTAVDYFRRYLTDVPDAHDRDGVLDLIDELERELAR